ncbi:MAG TPA: hypothetical protein VIM81_18370 [Gammaproteobacteria bacterium]
MRPGARPSMGWPCTLALALVPLLGARAQFPPPVFDGPPPPPREAAPFDMTGYWVSIVNEDWRWRMVTPPKGDYTSITMLSAEGRALADAWEPAEDGSCKAYGTAGLLRMPTRLRIEWESDEILRLETDAGMQTRLLHFRSRARAAQSGAGPAALSPPTLQGDSTAEWQLPARRGRPRPGVAPPPGGSLKVITTNLSAGWLRRNGVPYSEQTTLTEYFDRFEAPNGDEWLVATTVVEDPVYLTSRFVTSSHFKREPDDSSWNPKPCRDDRAPIP